MGELWDADRVDAPSTLFAVVVFDTGNASVELDEASWTFVRAGGRRFLRAFEGAVAVVPALFVPLAVGVAHTPGMNEA